MWAWNQNGLNCEENGAEHGSLGTPQLRGWDSDFWPEIGMHWALLDRYDLNQLSATPFSPRRACILLRSMSWTTRSNAAEQSMLVPNFGEWRCHNVRTVLPEYCPSVGPKHWRVTLPQHCLHVVSMLVASVGEWYCHNVHTKLPEIVSILRQCWEFGCDTI